MLKQFNKHEFPKNPDLKINSIVNGVYQDHSSEITKKLLEKLNITN